MPPESVRTAPASAEQREEVEVAERLAEQQARVRRTSIASIIVRVRGWTGKTTGISRAERRQSRDRLAEQRSVDEGGAVQGDEHVAARLDAEPGRRARAAEALLERDQRVDHRVADEVHALVGDPLGAQVLDRLVAVEEELVGELVGDDPVELLGHRAVEAAQARTRRGRPGSASSPRSAPPPGSS